MLRLGIYTDYRYSVRDGRTYAERAFALFVAALAVRLDRVVVIGRLDPASATRYPLGNVELVPLPNYPSLTHTRQAIRGMLGSFAPFWRALDDLDCVWILGPHPLAFPFAAMARMRRRKVILGVRQDSVAYMRNRHPGRRLRLLLSKAMETGFRTLARRWPVVAVGPAVAQAYSGGRSVLEISVSLMREAEIGRSGPPRSYDGELTALSVGRLEAEKNPLALADVIAQLRRVDKRWRLVICGEGAMREAVERRLVKLNVEEAVELRGYLSHDAELPAAYRDAHALAHVSWTEGLPQVLYEAFAAELPVVATDVGGIRDAAAGAALLVPPGDPGGIAKQLARVGRDAELRDQLIERGLKAVRDDTLESEIDKVAAFIREAVAEGAPPAPTN